MTNANNEFGDASAGFKHLADAVANHKIAMDSYLAGAQRTPITFKVGETTNDHIHPTKINGGHPGGPKVDA
jgi:hypothetical protein